MEVAADSEGGKSQPLSLIADVENALRLSRTQLATNRKNKKAYAAVLLVVGTFIASHHLKLQNLSIWALIPMWIVFIMFVLAYYGTDTSKFESDIESYESFRNALLGVPSNDNTYFDSLVKINITNLDAYYNLVKSHTGSSFRFSATVGFLGFGLISIGLVVGFTNTNMKDLSYITTGTGLIIEFISGVFFYLYNKNVRQLKGYHDSLLDVQNILLSFKLIEDTKDEEQKTRLIDKMIEFLVGKKTVDASNNRVSGNVKSAP